MIMVSLASLLSKIINLQTFATLSGKLYPLTCYISSYALDATPSLSSLFKAVGPPLLVLVNVSLQHINYGLPVHNTLTCSFALLFSHPSSKVLRFQIFDWTIVAQLIAHSLALQIVPDRFYAKVITVKQLDDFLVNHSAPLLKSFVTRTAQPSTEHNVSIHFVLLGL